MEVRFPFLDFTLALSSHPLLHSSEGVQVGGLRSSFGVLGIWTTIFHDEHDPVGKSYPGLFDWFNVFMGIHQDHSGLLDFASIANNMVMHTI